MINSDTLLERLRERATKPDNSYNHGHCANCQADLTAADIEAGECTNCHSAVESDDEDLADEYDWFNANGMFDDEDDD